MKILGIIGLAAIALVACGHAEPKGESGPTGDPDFPNDYRQWHQVNDQTIVREDEGVAREIFANPQGDLGPGTVLVKEQYRYDGGAKGPLEFVGVMRRTGTGEAGGWSFQAFDPTTRQLLGKDSTACVGCHTLQADSDYLFSDRSALTR
ncbi:MAG: cytochrome P460 family protein [Deltaproteobacteria bacterium]|nr:cytochrome P460 family protein [Deltaproteobacteria bacterium]